MNSELFLLQTNGKSATFYCDHGIWYILHADRWVWAGSLDNARILQGMISEVEAH